MRQPGEHDEEGEERDQREISEVAGMDETVRIDPDRDPLEDIEDARVAPILLGMIPTPFRRFWRDLPNGRAP
jgi:hypothetical protein